MIAYYKLDPYKNISIKFESRHYNGLVQDCNISIANALEILQSSTEPPITHLQMHLKCLIFHLQNGSHVAPGNAT